jgi:hypothetical protein
MSGIDRIRQSGKAWSICCIEKWLLKWRCRFRYWRATPRMRRLLKDENCDYYWNPDGDARCPDPVDHEVMPWRRNSL